MLILTEIVKFASFWIFLLSWVFFIHDLSRAFSLEHKRMAHILFFFFILINYSLVAKVWTSTMVFYFLLHPLT